MMSFWKDTNFSGSSSTDTMTYKGVQEVLVIPWIQKVFSFWKKENDFQVDTHLSYGMREQINKMSHLTSSFSNT